MNLANMMKQAQQLQKRLQDAKTELSNAEIKAEVANGAVTVICNGEGKFKSIKLTQQAVNVDAEELEMLEDLITSAMKKATDEANKKMQDKMKGIVPSGINIPGLF